MNPNLCRVALRPRSALEVFDLTLIFARANGPVLLRLAAGLLVLPGLLFVGLCWAFDGHPALCVTPLPFVLLLQAPFTVIGGRLLFQTDASARAALRDVLAMSGRLLGVAFAALIGLVLTALTCGYGGIPVLAAMLYVPETTLLERMPLARALSRSMKLTGGSFGVALVGAFAWVALTAWGAAVGEGLGQVVVDSTLQFGKPFGAVMAGQVTPFALTGSLAVQPLYALYRLLLYVDVRTRVEGWDLQVAFRAASLHREGRR